MRFRARLAPACAGTILHRTPCVQEVIPPPHEWRGRNDRFSMISTTTSTMELPLLLSFFH